MTGINVQKIDEDYQRARSLYAECGVDTEDALALLDQIPLSLHCWQGDDVTGFERQSGGLSGDGILATGNYAGKARDGKELRQDLDQAFLLIPGGKRVNLHAIYAETDGKEVDRDELSAEHFSRWIDWAGKRGIGLDFNPTFFSHKKAETGFTLASKDPEIRDFWIRHAKKCREIACHIGKSLGTPCVNNIWIPDGSKDLTVGRMEHRMILKDSLDEIFLDKYDKSCVKDAVESKLFGIGSEAYVVGSHEFYMGYAMKNDVMICLDTGHFHPTEMVSDKISAVLAFSDELLLHISRGIRWDSDHVAILGDEMLAIAQEIKRCGAFNRTHIALDYFDASINRISAWVIGARALRKALLAALLEPSALLEKAENQGNFGDRLAILEEFKTYPIHAVWNHYCVSKEVPPGISWLENVKEYEKSVLFKRG